MTRRTRRNPFTTVGDLLPLNAFNGALTHLVHGRAAVMMALGDSTVFGSLVTNGWFQLMGDRLGTYFDANVWMCLWNDTNQSYDPPTVRRVASLGERQALIISNLALQYTAPPVTGDIEIILKVTPSTWQSARALMTQNGTSPQKGWAFNTTATGALSFVWSANGTSTIAATSTAVVGFTAGNPGWVRVTLDVDNGASGNSAKFYTSTDGTTWTQLGTTVTTAGVTSLFPSTAAYQIWGLGGTVAFTWVQVRNALANGVDVVPTLPDRWDQGTAATATFTGAPTVLLMNGGAAGKNITYHDDPVRQPKMLGPVPLDVILLGDGHNDGGLFPSAKAFAERYVLWVRHIKNYRPSVPIIATTQNPTKVGSAIPQAYAVPWYGMRTAAMATAMALEPGVTVLDTHQAYTDIATQIQADGLHPEQIGHQLQCDWMLGRLAPKTML